MNPVLRPPRLLPEGRRRGEREDRGDERRPPAGRDVPEGELRFLSVAAEQVALAIDGPASLERLRVANEQLARDSEPSLDEIAVAACEKAIQPPSPR